MNVDDGTCGMFMLQQFCGNFSLWNRNCWFVL